MSVTNNSSYHAFWVNDEDCFMLMFLALTGFVEAKKAWIQLIITYMLGKIML